MAEKHEFGKFGEALATQLLEEKGYSVLRKNYRYRKAEVDIIAKKNDVYIAVEVKTRKDDHFGLPQEFIKPKQIRNIIMAMDHFMVDSNCSGEVRFDVISVIGNIQKHSIEHLEDAFYHF